VKEEGRGIDMTRTEAIKQFRRHWKLLAKTGTSNKLSYHPAQYWENSCSLCQFVFSSLGRKIHTVGIKLCNTCPSECPICQALEKLERKMEDRAQRLLRNREITK
jgi:hypothetical protein